MKKILLSVAFVSALALSGCKNENKKQESADSQSTKETTVSEQAAKGASPFSFVVAPESVVEWVGSKPLGKHNGTVNVVSGGVNVENKSITGGEFVLDMNTITVLDLAAGDGKEDLENHLKGTGKEDAEDHFFNVKKFPTATFVLKSFDGTNVVGDLTVKGTKKEVSFPASITVTDSEISIVSQPFAINRVDFGVNYGSKSIFDNLKDKYINDNIDLVVKVKATK